MEDIPSDELNMRKFCSEEKWPMELPLWLKLLLRLNSWLTIRRDGYPNRTMSRLIDRRVGPKERDGIAAQDVVIDRETGVWVRVFRPETTTTTTLGSGGIGAAPLVFYFHGGGFTLFSASSILADSFARYLAREFSAVVVSLDYRKTPEFRYPAAYEDGVAALGWAVSNLDPSVSGKCESGVCESGPLRGADLSKCFLVGESAGGNIAHHVAARVATATASFGASLTIKGVAALFPFFGSEERSAAELRLGTRAVMLNYRMCDAAWRDFLPEGSGRDHPAANPGPDHESSSNLPPLFVTVGEYDILKEHQVRFVEARRRAGQSVHARLYRGGIHCFHFFPQLRLTAQFHAHLAQFFLSCLALSDRGQ